MGGSSALHDFAEGTAPRRPAALEGSRRRWVAESGTHVLVVDPDVEQPSLRDGLASRGIHLTWVTSTIDALVVFGRTEPHAVVIAMGTPGISAAEFVRAIRRHGSPYVMAAGETVTDAAAGVLMAGAGAWLRRPYVAGDLWARLAASPTPILAQAPITVGRIELDVAAYRVSVDDRRVPDLPLKEFELLRALLRAAPEVVSDDELRAALWGPDGGSFRRNSIATHVTRLRGRLGDAVVVRRVRGRGYALSVEGGTSG